MKDVLLSSYRNLVLRIAANLYFSAPQTSVEKNDGINNASDSEKTGYGDVVSSIVSNKKRLRNFRRNLRFQLILEHLDYSIGKSYLKRIFELKALSHDDVLRMVLSDNIGNPIKYHFDSLGKGNPTTLRYVAVLSEFKTLAIDLNNAKVAEIGVGYGGQLRILSKHFEMMSYSIYDLPKVGELVSWFLRQSKVDINVTYEDIYNIQEKHFDFIFSNYAFSELPRIIQREYLEKVIRHAKHGYMIMNTGIGNESGRSEGKMHLEEILEYLPSAVVKSEIPKTGPDNYVLYW